MGNFENYYKTKKDAIPKCFSKSAKKLLKIIESLHNLNFSTRNEKKKKFQTCIFQTERTKKKKKIPSIFSCHN
jgi:tellurite resistance protein